MAQRTKLNLQEIEKYYRIGEDGAIWSYRHERYLRQISTTCGYLYVSLYPARTMTSVHKLVAQKYLGDCPPGCEVHHIDHNRMNNHYSNLEYITHAKNILNSFKAGRRPPPGNIMPATVKQKLAVSKANKKPIYCTDGRSWGSVTACAAAIGKTRQAIFVSIKEGRELIGVGGMLSFYSPASK